jgi:hypothetical protein
MIIGDRLRELREAKNLSQGDIEKRTGLLRCFHQLKRSKNSRGRSKCRSTNFSTTEEPPKLPTLLKGRSSDDIAWGSRGKDATYLHKLRKCLKKAHESDR